MSEYEYVLITAAYNEDAYIGATIEAVLAQSVIPYKWVIVSDGSTDNTDSIIKYYSDRNSFIKYVRREKTVTVPGFVSKVFAVNMGYSALPGSSYQFLGILDADVTFSRDYYARIISKLHDDGKIGIAGGFIYEKQGEQFRSRPSNTITSVAGAVQLFRRECYEAIGGHVPSLYGGEDWICEILARKNGWAVTAFPDIVVYHHKPGAAGRGAFRDAIRQGRMDYAIGSHPLFESVKCFRRLRERPYFVRALLRLFGFTWSAVKGDRMAVSEEVVGFLRREQLEKLKMHIHVLRK
jgi:poly-beta-1,6-N-acetyl-D-glucosamine synthase